MCAGTIGNIQLHKASLFQDGTVVLHGNQNKQNKIEISSSKHTLTLML